MCGLDEKYFLDKINNNDNLDEKELRELVEWSFDEVGGEHSRWMEYVTSYVRLGDKVFAIDWERGLTELQESLFYDQPYEVRLVEKVVTVKEWVKVEN